MGIYKRCAIFGASVSGEKCLYSLENQVSIECFFDNRVNGKFHGYDVRRPMYDKGLFILVAVGNYLLVREQLFELGYSEFKDFCPYDVFLKKIVVIYGNCHAHAVKQYLIRNISFAKEYGIYPLPAIQDMPDSFDYSGIMRNCDLFIHQSVRENNIYGRKYASAELIQYSTKKCEIISIPNLYGMGKCFFPQLSQGTGYRGKMPLFHYDTNVRQWIREGKTKDDMKKKIQLGGIYNKESIGNSWNIFIKKVEEREKDWDVKILDYIMKKYQLEKLFCDPWHISSILVREIARRTLEFMGIKVDIPYILPMMDDLEVFIYEDVKNALDLKFEEKYIRVFSKVRVVGTMDLNIDEYLCQLIDFTVRYGITENEG
ncbi:MAG: WcbI family polysaccharide biosynthesis putative acetyltransferase [Lachnospiraceae bacterium]|nr:WcbI family polysaccharide biosynthesis putative acetyltransferase [Lachnospiraceae bacterium]